MMIGIIESKNKPQSQQLISKTLLEGIEGITSPAGLASKLNVSQSSILDFENYGNGIICNISEVYDLPSGFPDLAFKDVDGAAYKTAPTGYLRSSIEYFYSTYLEVLDQRCFLGCKYLKYCVIPNVNTVIPNSLDHHIFEVDTAAGQTNLNQLTVCFPAAWETSNGGNMHEEAQYVLDNGGTVTFGDPENYSFLLEKPTKPKNLLIQGQAGTVANITFTDATSNNQIIKHELYIDGVYKRDVNTDFVIVFQNLNTQYSVKIMAVDEYYNRSDFSDELLINTEPSEPYDKLTAVLNFNETSGNILTDSYGFADAQLSGNFILNQAGQVGNAIRLNSAGSIQIPLKKLGFQDKVSINFWLKKDINGSVSESGWLRCNNSNAQGHYKYSNGRVYTDVFCSSRGDFADAFDITQMHMITITAERAGNMVMYRNASQIYSRSVGNSFDNFWDIFELGTSGRSVLGQTGINWAGLVEQLIFFHKVLNQAEIDYWYNSGAGRAPVLN